MSRFDDLDRFMQWQEATKIDAQNTHQEKIEESRTVNDPIIRKAFEVFGDYYQTVLQPRTDLIIIPKMSEKQWSTYGKVHPQDPYYTYLINLVHNNSHNWPHRNLDFFEQEHLEKGKLTSSDWHPNVAMQFALRLRQTWDNAKREYLPDLKPNINILVWDIIPKDPAYEETKSGNKSDASETDIIKRINRIPYCVSYNNAWDRNYSGIDFTPHPDQVENTENTLTEIFKIITPRVLNHTAFWRG